MEFALAALMGACLGSGLWLIFVRLPIMRQPRFVERIAPQLKSVDVSSRLLHAQTVTPFGPLERIIRPVARDAVTWQKSYTQPPMAQVRIVLHWRPSIA